MSDRVADRWIEVVASRELRPSEVRAVELDDLDLVVWRDAEGAPCVMDARCPHQWSHLEAEGVVDGDELVCTAHFWRFDRDGNGSKITALGRRDPKGDTVVYDCRERDGRIEARLAR